MNITEISQLTPESLDRLTSDQYRAAFDDSITGKEFATKVEALENAPRPRRGAGSTRSSERVMEQAPASTGFDPSFDDEPPTSRPAVVPAEPAAPAAAQPATVDESLPERIHEYQPVDRNGRPVGGLQRFKYRTDAELIEKLTKAHSASSARIRELSRDRKLEAITDAGVKQTSVPRPSDEVPATPDELAKELRAVRQSNYELAIRVAVNTWLERCPEYATRYKSQANNESVILAVARAGDDETSPDSYMRAFERMKDVLEPVIPIPAATAPVVEHAAAAAVVATPAPVRATQPAMIATGLSNIDQTSSEAPAVEMRANDNAPKFYTAAELDRMPSDQMRKLLRNPATAKKIDAVYEAEAQRKARR